MAGSSLLALLDDIATLLDDISVMTKVAAKNTAGVLGDDLALNAEQVSGVKADRELPVVWAVAKGSLVNKAILVPAALLISAIIPWAVLPLLMLGGLYLCFEGMEKVAHKFLQHGDGGESEHRIKNVLLADPSVDLVKFERTRIKGAIRTDFILSAEIIVITLGVVKAAPFFTQLTVLLAIALTMTVGVYGLVAGIVKLDDGGLYCLRRDARRRSGWFYVGLSLLAFAPKLMKLLSVAGTVAMFTVGGGILLHGLPGSHHFLEGVTHSVSTLGLLTDVAQFLVSPLMSMVVGLVAGAAALGSVEAIKRLRTSP